MKHYRIAAGRATNTPERNYLLTQAAQLSDSTTSADGADAHIEQQRAEGYPSRKP
jgi:hypothetical protein